MKYVDRSYSILNKKNDLEFLYSFKDVPVFMGCTSESPENDLFADMDWHISASTGMIQLNPLLPLEVLYRAQHAEAVGKIWTDHHQAFAEFIAPFKINNIFEIGGAHGILAKNYSAINPQADWTILEPNPLLQEGIKVKVIKGFFDDKFTYSDPYDAVVHSHVLEHVYNPSEFFKQLGNFVPAGKYHLFSFPNMLTQLANNYTNCLNFEHTDFLVEPYVDYMLTNNNFRIIKKEYFGEHSIFYAAQKVENTTKLPLPNLYEQNKKLFENFISYHVDMVKDLNEKIEKANVPVYLFGAHIFSQYLIAFGLKTDKIVCILDNGPMKIGKRLYGTNIMVESPKTLKGKGKVLVILKAGAYNQEISRDILENINPDTDFI